MPPNNCTLVSQRFPYRFKRWNLKWAKSYWSVAVTSIRLTPEGKILYQLVQPIAAGIDGLRETFAANLGKMEKGELNIAA